MVVKNAKSNNSKKMLNIQFLLKKGYTKELLTTLTVLDLRNNQIETIDTNAFQACSNLEELDLANNKLTLIEGNKFNQVTQLNILSLYGNQIKRIEAKAFETCSNLTELYLSNNKLTRIDENTFKQLTKLTKLWLSNNKIETIGAKAFENCTSLKELNLDNNRFVQTNIDTIDKFIQIEKLFKLQFRSHSIETKTYFSMSSFLYCFDFDHYKLRELYRSILNPSKTTSISVVTYNGEFGIASFSYKFDSDRSLSKEKSNFKKYYKKVCFFVFFILFQITSHPEKKSI